MPGVSRRMQQSAGPGPQAVVVALSGEADANNTAASHKDLAPAGPGLGKAQSRLKAQMTIEGLYPDADWLRISPLTGSTGLRLTGEADLHTAEILHNALAELVPPDATEIHLQLASLEFIDVTAARELAALTERPARPQVIMHYPPRSLILLLYLLWPDSFGRVRICGERSVPNPRPQPGTPLARGTGIGRGSWPANTGSQRCSLSTGRPAGRADRPTAGTAPQPAGIRAQA
jgi:hypothetical protein